MDEGEKRSSLPAAAPRVQDGERKAVTSNRWRRLPGIVKAWQYRGGPLMEDDPYWVAQGTEPIWHTSMLGQVDALAVKTPHGVAVAKNHDWIIQGPNGDYWPCKPDIFAATYEAVADVDGQCQVRRPSSAEPVPSSPSQAAVLGLVEALEEFLAAEEIVTKFENNELHADDETDSNDAYQRLEEARTTGRNALSRYRATLGQG